MGDKRKKGKNFTEKEVILLLDTIENYVTVVENKKTDATNVRQKNDAWFEITTKFNANSDNEERSMSQLKVFYDNFKRTKRKENADDKAELYKTGGGTYIKKLDTCGERLINMLKEQFRPDRNVFDSASKYHDHLADNDNDNNTVFELNVEENNTLILNEEKNEQDNIAGISEYTVSSENVAVLSDDNNIEIVYEDSTQQINDVTKTPCLNKDVTTLKSLQSRKQKNYKASASIVYKELEKLTTAKTEKKNLNPNI